MNLKSTGKNLNSMKKILIVNNNLNTGGVQKALVNLLYEIQDDYDITLFLFCNAGEYKKDIPKQITVIEANPILKLLGISQRQSRNIGWGYFLIRGVLSVYSKLFSNHLPIQFLVKTEDKMKDFDIAISFLHNAKEQTLYGGCNEFVLDRVVANEKISFVHCDFSHYGGNTVKNRQIYDKFDKIAVVSLGTGNSFIKEIPQLEERVYCVHNCHRYSEYIQLSEDNTVKYPPDAFNIVTVSRLSREKGYFRGIQVIDKLLQKGYTIRWYIVGAGDQREEIRQEIEKRDLQEKIILCGPQINPYRYVKNADLFLLPSYHEAAPLVFDEAKCLGVPILSTNTTSAEEMVVDHGAGWVCENSEEGIYNTLKTLLNNPEMVAERRKELLLRIYDNRKAIEDFHRLLSQN